MNIPDDKVILVTGSAGFIGFHVAHQLLQAGKTVVGVYAMIDYYSPQLKRDRTTILNEFEKFRHYEFYLEDKSKLAQLFEAHSPTYIIHLAAQAGVRHSLANPARVSGSQYSRHFYAYGTGALSWRRAFLVCFHLCLW